MVKPSRKKLAIIALAALTAATTISLAARPIRLAVCFALLSPIERKVVGEWKGNAMGGETVTTIRADHTWTSTGGCLEGTSHGRWAVDGADIVYSLDLPAIPDMPDPQPVRMPIQELIDYDRLMRSWAQNPPKK